MNNPSSSDSRRAFLGSSGAAAFSIMSARTALGSQANSKVSVGLIGCGNRGTHDATFVVKDARARVSALCDKYPDRIDTASTRLQLQKPAVYRDYEKLLSASDLDAVIIATPPFLHPEMLMAAVEAKKHVYCEKPAGVDTAGCRKVMEAGRKCDPKRNISFGYQQRYGPVYLEAYKRLQEGQIGELANARGFWISGDPFKRQPYPDAETEKLRNWFCYKDYSGDFIVEQDCHNFDVLHWFLGGLPLRAVGYGGRKVRTSMELLDHLSLSFEWPNGIHVNYEANQLTAPGFSRVGEEFSGTRGTLLTSRARMVHIKGPKNEETIESKRDITHDGIEMFIGRILSGDVENVAVRSAESTMIALLGRAAIYTGREATWKGEFGG